MRSDSKQSSALGFPTANIDASTELCPPPGVYACEIELGSDGSVHPAIANLGFRPTFAEQSFTIEAHLFDYDGDLYGERVRIHFVDKVRDELHFAGVEALVAQIHKDVEQVREALDAGADILLLDNMGIDQMVEAVKLARGRALTEASGGISLQNVAEVAETGVDLISVGALTHSARALDVSLDLL